MVARDYEKMSVFEQIQEGLTDSLAHARGELSLRTTVLPSPAPALSKSRVIAIRNKTGMSQAVFAGYLNVPKKTLQSWEQGARHPKAGEARLLQIFDADPARVGQIIQASAGRLRSLKAKSARSRRRLGRAG